MENKRYLEKLAEAQQNVIQRWPELTSELLSHSNRAMNEGRVSRCPSSIFHPRPKQRIRVEIATLSSAGLEGNLHDESKSNATGALISWLVRPGYITTTDGPRKKHSAVYCKNVVLAD